MRFLFALFLTVILVALCSFFLPWWTVALSAAAIALVLQLSPGRAFLVGFSGVFIVWLVLYLYHDAQNDGLFSLRMAQLFKLGNPWLFQIVGALVGGIVGGMSGLTGSLLRRAGQPARRHKTATVQTSSKT